MSGTSNRTIALFSGVLAVACVGITYGQVQAADARRILAGPRKGMPTQAARVRSEGVLRGLGLSARLTSYGAYLIELPAGADEALIQRRLEASGAFNWVQPDIRLVLNACPDDTLLGEQWHHNEDRLNSCAAWELVTGDPSIIIAVLDTGFDTNHPDLSTNRVEGYNGITRLFESQGGVIEPSGSHGTQVTGMAAAIGNNGFGVVGMGWDLTYRPVRVSDDGQTAQLSDVLDAAVLCAQLGDRVINCSFSGSELEAVRDTARAVRDLGSILVWGAGNGGDVVDLDRDDDALLVVGGTTINDGLASFSRRGAYVDVTAPGESVFTSDPGGGSRSVSGTSFSTPIVAGLAAMVWSQNPSLSADAVEQAIKNGTDDLGDPGTDNLFGYGRVDLLEALRADPRLVISFPDGRPARLSPQGGDTARVLARPGTRQPVPEAGLLHWFDGASWRSTTVLNDGPADPDTGEVLYTVVFPPSECLTDVEWYLELPSSEGTVTAPSRAPVDFFSFFSENAEVTAAQPFDSDQGWTVSSSTNLIEGDWEIGPRSTHTSLSGPATDADGSGGMAQTDIDDLTGGTTPTTPETGQGHSDVDGGTTTLLSPAWNFSDTVAQGGNARISVSVWFTNLDAFRRIDPFTPEDEYLTLEITGDGTTWTEVRRWTEPTAEWERFVFTVTEHLSVFDAVQVRFTASDGPATGPTDIFEQVVEAGIDAFQIETITCGTPFPCPADTNGDGILSSADFSAWIAAFNSASPACDQNNDNACTPADFSAWVANFNAGC